METNEIRYQIYRDMINTLDEGVSLIQEYDSLPHDYEYAVMYQAESQIIRLVGEHEGVTAAELAKLLKKTPSACSQLVRKLRSKGWIEQVRNEENNREYNLKLTEEGWNLYRGHHKFERRCYERSYNNLDGFTVEELKTYIAIQSKLNETFTMDVIESKETYGKSTQKKL